MGRERAGEKYARCSVKDLIPPDWLCDLRQVTSPAGPPWLQPRGPAMPVPPPPS